MHFLEVFVLDESDGGRKRVDGIDKLVIEHLLELGSIDMLDLDGEYIDLRSELADLLWVCKASIDVLLLAIRLGR